MHWLRIGVATVGVVVAVASLMLVPSSSSASDPRVCVYVAARENVQGTGTTVSTVVPDGPCPTMPPTNTSIPCGSSGDGVYHKTSDIEYGSAEARVCVMGL